MTWSLFVIGTLLRLINLGTPDMTTDEAQFALGRSAAQPPLGMGLMRAAQAIAGHDLIVVRGMNVLLGCITVWVIYRLARLWVEEHEALLAALVAAIFPAHILFSRTAYMDVPLVLGWLCVLLAFEHARCVRTGYSLLWLYVACVAVTFIKTQGLALPVLLLLGHIIERRGRVGRDAITGVLLLTLVPIAVYIAAHPGIAATLTQNTGTTYGIAAPLQRIGEMIWHWAIMLWLMLAACLLSLPWLRRYGWPVWALCVTAVLQQLLLGPSHDYYVTAFVILALPIGSALFGLTPAAQTTGLGILTLNTLFLLAPMDVRTPYTHLPLLDEPVYWNTHAEAINTALAGTDRVIVMGDAGHHVRWYLEPEVLVGKDMDLEKHGTFVVLDPKKVDGLQGTTVYHDGAVTIIRR